jgi:hypothetical protein
MLLIQVKLYRNEVLGAIKPKGLNRIAKIGYGHLCLKQENLSFINNYISLRTNYFPLALLMILALADFGYPV